MIEMPDNAVPIELMDFKKFAQSKKGCLYCEETIKLNGTFREKGSHVDISGDIIEAHKLGKLSIEEIYKVYLEWFNYTIRPNEKERRFVSVKLELALKEKKEKDGK